MAIGFLSACKQSNQAKPWSLKVAELPSRPGVCCCLPSRPQAGQNAPEPFKIQGAQAWQRLA